MVVRWKSLIKRNTWVDVINSKGSIQSTIDARKNKGIGIVAQILSMIEEIPLGKYIIEMVMKLREAMLINGMLYNSEA